MWIYKESSSITKCHNTGSVSGTSFYIGGVCGTNSAGTGSANVTNCYYDSQRCIVGGISTHDVEGQAEGETTAAMTSGSIGAIGGDAFYGFGLAEWVFIEASYPCLRALTQTYEVSATTNSAEENGITATATVEAFPYAEDEIVTVTITLPGTAVEDGTHTVGLNSTQAGTITGPNPVTKLVTGGNSPTDIFAFTFTMPGEAVDDLEVTNTYKSASAVPTAVVKTVTKPSVNFTLTNAPAGDWAVHDAAIGENIVSGVIATVDGTTLILTLKHETDISFGIYYVSVTEAGKAESKRLALSVIPATPAAPTLESKTDTTITVVAVVGQEYSKDNGGTWQNSNVFSGLTANNAYSIVTRVSGTATTVPSATSTTLAVTTKETVNSHKNHSSGTQTIVNDDAESVGTTKTSTNTEGQTVTTVTIDREKLSDILEPEGSGATVTIPVAANSEVATRALNGQMIKDMETQEATLEIQTNLATYIS